MKISEQIIARIVENKAVVINLNNGEATALDEIGTIFWKSIIDNDYTGAIKLILDEYDVDEEKVKTDYNNFVEKMKTLGIITEE